MKEIDVRFDEETDMQHGIDSLSLPEPCTMIEGFSGLLNVNGCGYGE
jgi:hypothetical protein